MRRVFNVFCGLTLVVVLGMMASPAGAQFAASADLTSSVEGPASVAQGAFGTYTVTYGNLGPQEATNAFCNFEFPAGVPDTIDLITQDQADAIVASATDTAGNSPLLFINSGCDALLIQTQGPDPDNGPLGSMTVGASNSFSITTDFPMTDTILVGGLEIDSPAAIAGAITNLGRGSCSDCDDVAGTCFGEPLTAFDLGSLPVEIVDDGSADPTYGCNPFTLTTPGAIAIIERGSCEFGTKVFNAESAGAAGALIWNSTLCSSNPSSPECTIPMGPGDLGELTTIPAVMITNNQGQAIADELANGPVMVTLGGLPTSNATFNSTIFHSGTSTDTDPDGTNNDGFAVTTIGGGGQLDPPVADFTFTPAAPMINEDIQFTDASTGGAATEWLWDFGDAKATSTEQNPVYQYDTAGTYDVSLTATNADGSDTMTKQVTVSDEPPPVTLDQAYFVSAAAFASGSGGAFFQTDFEINNGGTTAMNYKLVWLPRGEDNSTPTMSDMFTLGAGMSVRYLNVLSSVFGAADGALGAVAVFADSADALIMTRTYAIANGETFGQAIPGVFMDNMIMSGEKKRITFMTENDSYRANLGFQNGTNVAMTVNYELFGADGVSLGTFTANLMPWSNTQVNRAFRNFAPLEIGYVDVWTTTADASFYAYGSVLDNVTTDPTTILPQ